MSIPSDLRSRVLQLAQSDRAALAHDLLVGLELDGIEPDPDYEESWRVEIEDRLRSIEEGRARLLTREEVEARLRATVYRVRQNRAASGDPPGRVGE